MALAPRDSDGRFLPGTHWRPHTIFREREYLLREYVERGRSTAEIATEHGVTDGAIIHWLTRHGIRRRSTSEARSIKYWGLVGEENPMFGKKGSANPRYVDGSSPERQRAYSQATGKAFIRAIFSRDGYKCRRCGEHKSGVRSLHAHHIAPWAGNEALRFDTNNVATLCRQCHQWVHSKANVNKEWLA